MNRERLLEFALNDKRIKTPQQAIDWLNASEVIELPGGAMLVNGHNLHLLIEPYANKHKYIKSLKGALDIAFKDKDYLTGRIPVSNKKMIKVAEWHGFHVERERDGHIEVRKNHE